MTETEREHDTTAINRTIRQLVRQAGSIDRDSVVALTAIEESVPQRPVRHRLDELEREGEVYTVPADDGMEVRLP